MRENFTDFWEKQPALYLGCVVFFFTFFALTLSVWILLALAVFIAMTYQKLLQTMVLGLGTFLYVWHAHPPQNFENAKGIARVDVQEIQTVPTHYGKRTRAAVVIRYFEGDGVELFNQKAFMYAKKLDSDHLLVRGNLTQWSPHMYMLKAKEIHSLDDAKSAKKRANTKKRLYRHIRAHMGKDATDLIYALLSGEVVSLNLRMLFARLGISHLLAISGFHFSILIGVFSLFMKRVNRRVTLLVLFSIATGYFLFVGGFASIKRAYLMLLVLLVGEFFEFEAKPLNTLGACMLILLVWDPTLTLNLGFQLSFLATFSILLFYNPTEEWLCKFLPKRNKYEIKTLNNIELCGYVFLSLFRKVFAVNIAVSVLCIPVVLHYFEVFPLFSFYYNCFMPLIIAFVLITAIVGVVFTPLLVPLGAFVSVVLEYLAYFPVTMDVRIETSMPIDLLTIILLSSITIGINYNRRGEYERREMPYFGANAR